MTKLAYQYVVLRCVPRVDREEFVNVGVVLYCQATDFLQVAWSVDADRLRALDPGVDVDHLGEALSFVEGVCVGDKRGGAASDKPTGTRFGFLRAPQEHRPPARPRPRRRHHRPRPPARPPPHHPRRLTRREVCAEREHADPPEVSGGSALLFFGSFAAGRGQTGTSSTAPTA